MRLHPQVTQDEVYAWLRAQAEQQAPSQTPEMIEAALKPIAESMAAIASVVLPDNIEPLFP